jgi:hypothetical protein
MNLTIPQFTPAMASPRSTLSIPTISKPALKVPQLQRSGNTNTPEHVQAITLKIKSLFRASELCTGNPEALHKIEEEIDNLGNIFGIYKQTMLARLGNK